MISEAVGWTLLALLAPVLAPRLWARFSSSHPSAAAALPPLAPWLHGVAIPYLALLAGSVSGRDFGLYALPEPSWSYGLPAISLGLLAVALVRRRWRNPEADDLDPWTRWLDEPRWALYRATGGLLLDSLAYGTALGIAVAACEWCLAGLAARRRPPLSTAGLDPLIRALTSGALFLITGNFWLTAGAQLLLLLLLQAAAHPPGPAPEQ